MKFYIVASLLLLVATLVDIRAKSIAAEASLCVAELAQGEKHEQDAESLHSEIQDIRLRAGTYHLAGWLFCATGVGCIFVSRWRKEKGTMVVPIVLIALYLLMMIQQV